MNVLLASTFGFLFGVGIGYLLRGMSDRRSGGRSTFLENRWESRLRIMVGLVVLGMAAYSTYTTSTVAQQQTATASCQHQANVVFEQALSARAASSKASNDAQLAFLGTELDPTATPAARAAAGQTYLAALRSQNDTLTAHPLLTPTGCGG